MSNFLTPTTGALTVKGVEYPQGDEINRINTAKLDYFFKNAGGNWFTTEFTNQTNYPKYLKAPVVTFMRGLVSHFALQYYNEELARIMPISLQDSIENTTVIYELEQSTGKKTSHRAPKTDLKGAKWSMFKNKATLYGNQATILKNNGDDGGFGQETVRLEMLAQGLGMDKASILEALQKLLAIPDQRYVHLEKMMTDDIKFITAILRRRVDLWNGAKQKDGFFKLENRSILELTEQQGQANQWLVSESLKMYMIFRQENRDYYIAGTTSDGPRNKTDGMRPIGSISGTRVTELPKLRLDRFHWNPLETHSVTGEAIQMPSFRPELNYIDYNSMWHSVKITDSDEKNLAIITELQAVQNSYIYDKKDGSVLNLNNYYQNHRKKPAPTNFKASDMFWNEDGSAKTKFYEIIGENDVEIFMSTCAMSAYGYCLRSGGYTEDSDKNLWSFLTKFIATRSSLDAKVPLQSIYDFLISNETLLSANNENEVYDFSGSEHMIGFSNSIIGLRGFAKSNKESSNSSDVKMLLEWLNVMDKNVNNLLSLFEDFSEGVFYSKDHDDRLHNWMKKSLFIGASVLSIDTAALSYLVKNKNLTLFNGGNTVIKTSLVMTKDHYDALVLKFSDIKKILIFPTSNTYSTKLIQSKTDFGLFVKTLAIKTEYKYIFEKISEYGIHNSSYRCIALAFLYSRHTKKSVENLLRNRIPKPYGTILMRPMKKFVAESMLKLMDGGQTIYRICAFPEQSMGQSLEGSYYKIIFQAYFGSFIALPENFCSFDNVFVTSSISGDTSRFTVKLDGKPQSVLPNFFAVATPLGYKKPKNWIDISGKFRGEGNTEIHTIPNFDRYNILWGIEQKDARQIMRPFTTKIQPLEVQEETMESPNNYICTYEDHQIYDEKNGWKTHFEDSYFKGCTENFYAERYSI